jgi:hypothetical protein
MRYFTELPTIPSPILLEGGLLRKWIKLSHGLRYITSSGGVWSIAPGGVPCQALGSREREGVIRAPLARLSQRLGIECGRRAVRITVEWFGPSEGFACEVGGQNPPVSGRGGRRRKSRKPSCPSRPASSDGDRGFLAVGLTCEPMARKKRRTGSRAGEQNSSRAVGP